LPRLGSRVRIPSPAPNNLPKNQHQASCSADEVPVSNSLNEPRTVPSCAVHPGKRRAKGSQKVLDGDFGGPAWGRGGSTRPLKNSASADTGTANRNLGDTKNANGKRDPGNRDGLGEESAQTPIRATLIGSNRCEALSITARGHASVPDLCRALVKAGHDPRRPLHAYRGDVLALKVRSIGEGARLTVREDRAGPRFVAWEPFPRRVGAMSRQKAEGVGSPPDQSNEPSAPPGAAVRASAKSLPNAHSGTRRRPR
jgi:hypothetical protein